MAVFLDGVEDCIRDNNYEEKIDFTNQKSKRTKSDDVAKLDAFW